MLNEYGSVFVVDLPHNCANQPHNDVIQDIEKLQHQPGLFSHFAHNNTKSNKKPNQT